jgi:hypothetical protein
MIACNQLNRSMMVALASRRPRTSSATCTARRAALGIDQRGHDAGTAGTQRVADRDGPAVDVGLRQIGPGVVRPGQCRLAGAWIRRLNAAILSAQA